MTLLQALRYFLREAFVSLVRSWKISLLAILTIAVSLFLGGIFLLVSTNLADVVQGWQDESKLVLYFTTDASEGEMERLREDVTARSWTLEAEVVSAAEARQRFSTTFPSLSGLLDSWGEKPLPASLEVRLDWTRIDRVGLQQWADELLAETSVSMVDVDQDWLEQLQDVVVVLRGLGLVFGGILLVTAVFTISSVIRLTAFLYRDEIAVMRMVGATEFFIRGPFYLEGFLQGLIGALLAIAALWFGYDTFVAQEADRLATTILAAEFLTPAQVAALMGLGAAAGLVGAITSLRRESLGEGPGWSDN